MTSGNVVSWEEPPPPPLARPDGPAHRRPPAADVSAPEHHGRSQEDAERSVAGGGKANVPLALMSERHFPSQALARTCRLVPLR